MKYIYMVPVFVVVVLNIILYSRIISTTSPSSEISQFDIEKFSIESIIKTGKIDNKILETDKLIILNFFSNWCDACKEEHDLIVSISKCKDILIYGVIVHDNPENVKKFLKDRGNPYIDVGNDANGQFSISMGVISVPTTILIKDNKIINKINQPITKDIYNNYIKIHMD